MDAVKNNIRKVLAIFLCACLLFAYDPAFSTTGSAFADEGAAGAAGADDSRLGETQAELDKIVDDSMATGTFDPLTGGTMGTDVSIRTFDDRLETESRLDFSATIEELKAGSAGGVDVRYMWFEATGGTPASDGDPYDVTWEVRDNGQPSQGIVNWLTSTDGAIEFSMNDGLARYDLNLQKMANETSLLADGHEYTFVGTFTDASGEPAGTKTQSSTLFTVASDMVNYKWGDISPDGSNSDLVGVEAEGYRVAGTKLDGGKMLPTSSVSQAMENKVAADTMADGSGDYVLGDVLQLNANPTQLPGTPEGVVIPPFSSNKMEIRLPIEQKYLKSDDNPAGYEEGSRIKVLWSGGASDTVVTVDAVVVKSKDGDGWCAQVVHPFGSTAPDAPEAEWPALPGCFAIEYDTNKLPDDEKEESRSKYFAVSIGSISGGTVSPAEKRYWKIVNDGATASSPSESATYTLTPLSMGTASYELSKLTLTRMDTVESYDFLNGASAAAPVGRLDTLKHTLTLTNAAAVFEEGSEWRLSVRFTDPNAGGGDPEPPTHHGLTVNSQIKRLDGTTSTDFSTGGGVIVSYYPSGEGTAQAMKPEDGKPSKDVTVSDVLSTAQAKVHITVPAPKDGIYYELAGITVRVGEGALEPQQLENPFIVLPTDQDVTVAVLFAETKSGGPIEQPEYTVEASVGNPDMGRVVSVTPNTYGDDMDIASVIRFEGAHESSYLSYVELYLDDRTEPERVPLNPEKKRDFSWQMPNYHANVRVVGYFDDSDAPSVALTVQTDGNGSVAPLNWTLNATGPTLLRSGKSYPMTFAPKDGYELDDLTLKTGTGLPVSRYDQVKGGVWNYVPNSLTDGAKVTVSVTFRKTNTGPGEPGGPGGDGAAPVRVNVYVADSALNSGVDDGLAYLFDPPTGDAFVNDDPKEGESNAQAVSVADYSKAHGLVNGQASLFDTVDRSKSYPLNLYGTTLPTPDGGSQRYGIEKLLVVSYRYATDSNGEQVKTGMKWSLYHTTTPFFELQNLTANTDVIAYFAPVDEEAGPGGPGGGFTEEDFVRVLMSSNVPNMVMPPDQSSVPVLKGAQLPLKFTMNNAEYELGSATVTPSGSVGEDIMADLRTIAATTGSNKVTYTLKNVLIDTEVKAAYEKRPEEERTKHEVRAKVTALDEEGSALGAESAEKPCLITVGTGANFSQPSYLSDGDALTLLEGSDLRLALQRGNGFALKDMSFTWDAANVFAYIADETATDGSVKRTLRLTTNADELVGKKPYKSGDALYGIDGAPDESVTIWYVEDLLCALSVEPTYQKKASSGQPDPDEDAWTLTTKVGTGLGQIFTDSPNFSGSVTKVPKGSVTVSNPLTISMQPAEGQRIKDIRVSSSTGNAFFDFWTSVLDFMLGDVDVDKMKEEAIANGYIKLKAVDKDYQVTVDFEAIPDEFDPDGPLGDSVAVNVVYDSDKGEVTPNMGVTAKRTDSQFFVAKPQKEGDRFYSVVAVKVQVGDGQVHEVAAIDKTSSLVRWGDEYPNTFLVDLSKLTWPSDDANAAVTVEVVFSDTADSSGGGNGGGTVAPGTPDPSETKSVVVNLVTDGVPVVGENGIGGVVSPRGAFTLVPQTIGGEATACEQRVYVSPSAEYELEKIAVTRDGQSCDGVAYGYMQELKTNGGYFVVTAEPVGSENITVYLKKKPLSERSYSVLMVANGHPSADAFVSPLGEVTLPSDGVQTFSIDPVEGVWVRSVTDEYRDEKGDWHPLPTDAHGKPQGATWDRGSSTEPKNWVEVGPVKVKGKVVDRRVTVTFQNSAGVDHGISDKDKANLRVQAFGAGSEFLTFTPAEDMLGVWKGTTKDPASYTYRYALSEEAAEEGYAIYRVQANGADVFGAADNVDDLKVEGDYVFTTANMRPGANQTNNLFVYVRQFTGGTNGEPVVPVDPEDTVDVDYGCGDGGTIADKVPGSHESGEVEGSTNGSFKRMKVAVGEPFTLLMTPDASHVLDKVYLHNCRMLEFYWVTPADGRTAKVALEYTLEVIDPTKAARVFAVFKRGSSSSFKPWSPDQVGDNSFDTDGKLIVKVSPALGVEKLVTMVDGMPAAGDMLQVSNPVAPFAPSVNVHEEEGADGYALEFDTISKLSDPGNVRLLVGPLIKWDASDSSQSVLYTVDEVKGLQDGFTVKEKPLETSTYLKNRLDAAAGLDDATHQQQKEFYTYYEVSGKLADPSVDATEGGDNASGASTPVVSLNLRQLGLADGRYPEYDQIIPEGMVRIEAAVDEGEGTIAPVASNSLASGAWFGENAEGPWLVPENTRVAFKVSAAEGFVLSSLAVNDTDALGSSFDAEKSTLSFRATSNSTVVASFVTEDSPEAMRTVTVEVQGGHGTTDPAPARHQVKKGDPCPIKFKADKGYVPYRIWVDGVESYVSPTLSGWMLPASWSDQTFKVQYAVAGTTPGSGDYLNQAGQNLLNQAGATLAKTGDNPWLPEVVLLLVVAGAAAFGAMRFRRASEAAGRVAKYSVTKRSK